MQALLGFLLDLVSVGRIPLNDVPTRGDAGGWILGVLVLVGATALATIQALLARAS
jgi:hypothetical protein